MNSPTSVASSYSYDSHGNISGISAHYTYLSPSSPLSKHVKFAQSGPRRRYTKDTSGYACDVAGCRSNSARYDTLSALKHHQRCHRPEEERRHECPYCKKRFEFPKDKKRHMKIHTGEKVECSICGHKSTRPDQLRVHQRRCHGTASSWGGSETGSSSAMTRGSAPSSFSYVTSDTSIESLLPDHTRNEGELVAFTSHCDDDDYAQLEHINGADSGDSRKQLALEAESCSCPPEQCHASACPLGVPLPPETVARLVAQFKALWRSAAKDAGSSGSSEPYPQAHADTPSQQRTSWGHRASLKRRRSTAGDGNGEEDGEERHPRRSGDEPSQESSFEEPKFACPIAIIFRSRFSNCNARGQCCWINGHTRFCDVT